MSDFVTSVMLLGALSSTPSELPYWATAGRYGIMPEESGCVALVQAGMGYDEGKDFQWHWGASLGVNTNRFRDCSFLADEAYAGIKWKVLTLDVGLRRSPVDYIGASPTLGSLSTSGGHYIESGNCRSMPGYTLRLEPWAVPYLKEHLWLYGAFGDYRTIDDATRFVKGALVHKTEFGARVQFWKLNAFAGIEHRAMWGGFSPEEGQLPQTLHDYFLMLTGQAGMDGSMIMDQMNVIGNQLGAINVGLGFTGNGWSISFKHDAPYDDKSGMRWENFPDGINTLCFSFADKEKWVTDILYEFIYTMNQSGWRHDPEVPGEYQEGQVSSGDDDYFNNGAYKSGWTHFNRTIGLPLFTIDRKTGMGIENNRIKAHHIGIGGKLFRKFPYRLMATYTMNYGRYEMDYFGQVHKNVPPGTLPELYLGQFAAGLDTEFPLGKGFLLTCGIYGDVGDQLGSRIGMAAGLKYTILPRK